MTTVYRYRVYCSTDSTYEFIWAETEPTTCPTNTAHSIDSTKTVIVDTIDSNLVSIKEESTPTGGFFESRSFELNATGNQVTTLNISFPYPISALSMSFVSEAEHKKDCINMSINKEQIIGVILSNVSPASAWLSQNYTAGSIVTYNSKVYTCILDTVSNEDPLNITYWQHGYELTVNSTVYSNTNPGFEIKLDDFTNNDEMGSVILVDKTNGKIYIENNPTNSYTAGVTYVRQSIYYMRNFYIGGPWNYVLGESKIGGSYLPANTVVTIDYENKTVDNKYIVGVLEYLH